MCRTPAARAIWTPGAEGIRASEHGYVLIELMLALVIVSLLAGLALPWPSTGGGAGELRSAASRIAVLLRADRNAALRGGLPVVSEIDRGARSVRSGAGGAVVVLPARYRILASDTLAGGVRFDPDGHAQGGEIAVLNGREQHVVLTIDPVSAAIVLRGSEVRDAP